MGVILLEYWNSTNKIMAISVSVNGEEGKSFTINFDFLNSQREMDPKE